MSDSTRADVLRLGARVVCTPADLDRLASASARVTDWSDLPSAAEAHGIAPLLSQHLAAAGVTLPIEVRQHLVALSLHHREANRVRFQVLVEVLDALDAASIPAIVLKGAALAHLLYPAPQLRPTSDLDLLVAPPLAVRAQSVLADLGFKAPRSPFTRALAGHHHLPAATRFSDGQIVHVEVHVDALSRDTGASLSMSNASGPPQPFSVGGRAAQALGHADMLYHLMRHAAECTALLRLIWVADLVGYATRFRDVIPWTEVGERYPAVINALSLLHLVTSLPPELQEIVRPAKAEGLRGIGVSCKPLSDIVARNRSLGAVARDIFDPSDWWLRLYYGLGDESPLWWFRSVVHPARVGGWIVRRWGASIGWWAGTRLRADG